MDYLSALILYCVDRFNGERSINAVYYLLKGKKSSQTIQDACWYNLRKYFHVLPQLNQQQFQGVIRNLLNNGMLVQNQHTIVITPIGKQQLDKTLVEWPIPKELDGWKFHPFDTTFWERLSLSVQVVSNLLNKDKSYYPVQRGLLIQQWAKIWLLNWKNTYSVEKLGQEMNKEMSTLFSRIQNFVDPFLIVYRLTGHKSPGYTSKQVADFKNFDETYYSLCFLSSIHTMISTIWKNNNIYPILFSILGDLTNSELLTQSTKETYDLIKQGKSITEIAQIRKLKMNTIEDHLVEMALLVPSFSIDEFVPKSVQEQINQIATTKKSRKLKTIKDQIPDVDYFTIRLVLSRISYIKE